MSGGPRNRDHIRSRANTCPERHKFGRTGLRCHTHGFRRVRVAPQNEPSQEFMRPHQFELQCPLRERGKCCCRNNAAIAENESIPLPLSLQEFDFAAFAGRKWRGETEREREKGGSHSPTPQTSALLATEDRHNEMTIRLELRRLTELLPVSLLWFLSERKNGATDGPPIDIHQPHKLAPS